MGKYSLEAMELLTKSELCEIKAGDKTPGGDDDCLLCTTCVGCATECTACVSSMIDF